MALQAEGTPPRWCCKGTRWLALAGVLACSDPGGTEPRPPLNASLTLTPDSTSGWVDDQLHFRLIITGPDRDSVRRLTPSWVISDLDIASFVAVTDSSADVVIRADGRTSLTAAIDTFATSAALVGFQEGALLADRAWTSVATLESPAVAKDGTIYLIRSGAGAALLAFDANLTRQWEADLLGTYSHLNPAVGPDGTIYFASSLFAGAVSASGMLAWRDTANTEGLIATAIDTLGSVFIPGEPRFTSDWAIVRYDPPGIAAVRIPWPGGKMRMPVIVADSVIVVTDLSSQVFAHTRSGNALWVDTLPSIPRFFGAAVGADGRTVYIPTQLHVVALDGVTGSRLWEWQAASLPVTPLIDASGTLYVQQAGGLTALRPDGTVRWSTDSVPGLQGRVVGGVPALAAGGVLYAACREDLCAVNTSDGSVRWRRPLPVRGRPGTILVLPDSSILFVTLEADPDSSRLIKLRGRFPLADAPWPVEGGDLQRTRRAKVR